MPIPRPIPRPSPNGPPTPRPAPPTPSPRVWPQYLAYAITAALFLWAAYTRFTPANPGDPTITAGREYADALGKVYADALDANRKVVVGGGTVEDGQAAQKQAWESGRDAAFARLLLPIVTTIAPAGSTLTPEQRATYDQILGKIAQGARSR